MSEDLRQRLRISTDRLDAINSILLDVDMRAVNDFLDVVTMYGTPEEINAKAVAARQLPALLKRVEETQPAYLADLEWLAEQRDRNAFISVADYRRKVLGETADMGSFADDFAVGHTDDGFAL